MNLKESSEISVFQRDTMVYMTYEEYMTKFFELLRYVPYLKDEYEGSNIHQWSAIIIQGSD